MTPTAELRARLETAAPDRIVLLWGGLLVALEALAVLLFWGLAPVSPTDVLIYVYPFVWINLGLWALLAVDPADAPDRKRLAAGLLAGAYFLVLAYAGGMIGPPHTHGEGVSHAHELTATLRVATIPPGWGPMLAVEGGFGFVQLMPYQVIGYLALGYLLYVTVLDAATAAVGGALGVLTCVSCSWPVMASLVGGLLGSTAGATAVVYARPYGLATVAFMATVAVLAWRPMQR